MFNPEIFGFEKWDIGEKYNLFVNKNKKISSLCSNFHDLLAFSRLDDCKIFHLTQRNDKTWLIELVEKSNSIHLYQGYIPNNDFAFGLFDNFEFKIPNLYNLIF